MFKGDRSFDRQLFAYSPRDMVPDDSDVWLYIDLFDALNLDGFYAKYSSQGQDSLDCRLMLRTIFYGITHGVCSGRKLATACQFDNRYMVLVGAHTPNFRTISRFFVRHEKDLEELFVQVVRLAQSMGLVSLGRIAIDGSRMKGNASRKGLIRYEKLDAASVAIKKQIAELKAKLASENHDEETDYDAKLEKEIANREQRLERIRQAKDRLDKEYGNKSTKAKVRVALNDTDARVLGRDGAGANYVIGYNCQASVDGDHQIIVAAEIHDSGQDGPALVGMIEKTKENCGISPGQVLADKGYCSSENIVQAATQCKDLYISLADKNGNVPKERSEQVFAGENGEYVCMARKPLRIGVDNGHKHTVTVLADPRRCDGCALADDCMLYGRRDKTTVILDLKHGLALGDMARRSRSKEFQEIYKQRKAIVEPAFGNIKWNKMLRIFVRGKRRVSCWWKTACTAHNIEKVIKNIRPSLPKSFQLMIIAT